MGFTSELGPGGSCFPMHYATTLKRGCQVLILCPFGAAAAAAIKNKS